MLLIIFIIINILLAYIDAHLISGGIAIDHFNNALIYCMLLLIAFASGATLAQIIAIIIIRIPVFNTALNLFRGLPYDYVSKSPASIIDRIAQPVIYLIGYDNYNLLLILSSITIYQ